ncbi:MAG: type II secretion system protein GspG [Planctomycetota bacterium]
MFRSRYLLLVVVLATVAFVAASCLFDGGPPKKDESRYVSYVTDQPDAPNYVSKELEGFMHWARMASHAQYGGYDVSPLFIMYAAEIAGKDGTISLTEFDFIRSPYDADEFSFKAASVEPPTMATSWKPCLVNDNIRGHHKVFPFVLRPGPFTPDPTNADPSLIFGRKGAAPKESLDVYWVDKYLRDWHPRTYEHLPTAMLDRARGLRVWRVDAADTGGAAYLYHLLFKTPEQATAFSDNLTRMSRETGTNLNWQTTFGIRPEDVTKVEDHDDTRTTTTGFVVQRALWGTELVVLLLRTTDEAVQQRLRNALQDAHRARDAWMAELNKRAAAETSVQIDAGFTDRAHGQWPPDAEYLFIIPREQFHEWGMHDARASADDPDSDEAYSATVNLMIAAQMGHALAAVELVPRLRIGIGVSEPQPGLADAWEKRIAAMGDLSARYKENIDDDIENAFRPLIKLARKAHDPAKWKQFWELDGFHQRFTRDPSGRVYGPPQDPWAQDYQVTVPTNADDPWVITSLGRDGKPGGKGEDADIVNRIE